MADTDDTIVNLDDLEDNDNIQSSDDSGDDYEPSSDVVDIDDEMNKTFGDVPDPNKPFTMAEEIEDDEADRRDAPDED